MCSDKKLVKGVIDPISIIGVLFLVATLTLGINTVRNKNIQLKTEREASSCFDECRKESGTQVCNCRCYGQCTRPDSHTDPEAAEKWNITPPPANPIIDRTTNSTCPTGYIACGGEGLAFNFCLKADLGKSCNQSAQEQGYTVPTSNITCNAQNINTVAVGSNNQFLRCDGTRWTTQCNNGKDCAIEDLTIIPTHLQQQYDQAILALTQQVQEDQNQTGETKPDYSPTQNESTETSASQSTYTNSSCNSQCKFNESCVHIGYGYYGCQTTNTVRSVGEKQCNGNNLETWNGTRWEARYCEFGCLNGGCVARVQANIEVNRDDNGVTRDLTYLYRDAEQNIIHATTAPIQAINVVTQNIQEQKKQNGDLCSYNGECESNKCAQTGTPVKRCVANMTQLEQVYSGLNTITLGTFGDYVSAFQQPRPTREQTNERIQACIDSGQSAYYCMRQATSLTPEQVGSSVALGTVITTELALLGTGFNYAVGASTGTAAMTNAMTAASLYQSGRAVDFCVNNPNSTECYLETVYAVTSIANVGSAANLARATGSAIQTARLINTGINVLNLGVDAIDVTMNCLGENRNGLGCGIAIGATVLDIGGGVLDIGDIVSDFKYGLQGLDSNLGAWPVGETFQPVNNAFDNIIKSNLITGNPIPTTLDTAILPQIPQGINIPESGGLNLSTFLPAPLGSGDNILPIINRDPATIQGQTALMNEWFPATRPQLDPETIIRGGIPVIPSDLGTPFNPNHLKVAWDFKMPKDFAIQPLPLPEDDPLRTLYTNQGIVPDEAIRSQIDIALRPEFQKPITDPPQPNWIHETIYSPTDGFLPAVKNWWDDIINPKINTTSGLIPTKGTIEISKLHPHEFGYNPRTVDELTSILEKGKTLDPVKITEYNGQLYTYDGANRVTVYARSGQEQVPYIFTKFDSLSDLDRLLIETASTGNYGVYQFPKKYGADFPISPIQSTRDSNYIDESWFQQTTYSPTDGFLPAVKNWWDNSPINWKNRDIGLGGSPAMDPSNTDQVINKPNQIHWSADIGKATDSIVNTVRYPTHNSLENFLPINLVVVASLPLISDNPILLVPVSILTAFQSQQIYKMRQNMIVFGDDLLVEPTKNFKKVSITSNYQGSSVTSNIDHNTLIGELHVGTWQSLQKYKGMNKFEAAVQMQSTLMSSVIDLGHAVKNNDPRIKDIEVFYGVSNIIKGSFEKYGFMVKPYQTSPFKKQLHLTAVRLVHLRSEGLGGVFYSPLEIFRNVMNGGISEFKIFKEMDDLKEVYITKEALINALPQLERDYQRILDRFQLK